MVSHHLAKFVGHKHYGSRGMALSICHVICQDHALKDSCDLVGDRWEVIKLSHHPVISCDDRSGGSEGS